MTPEEERAEIARLDRESARLRAEGDRKFREGFRQNAEEGKRRVWFYFALYGGLLVLDAVVALICFLAGYKTCGAIAVAMLIGVPLVYVLRILYYIWKFPRLGQLMKEETERFIVRAKIEDRSKAKRDE